ncbi:MAG: ornithine cyclodeaminase [Massilia sp.]|jgi:ornithine cyclodeaminase/alanine dehydrogenase-like protein (mu-crystallin family)|nr:ornithine cyclodeaminase [Massilia sp.]
MNIIDAAATRAALPFDTLIAALESRFIEGCTVPLRHVHKIGEVGTTLIMPAWQERYLGIKTVNIFPGNSARGLPALFSTYILYDAASGAPLAHIDGNEITSRRTAAASALAARFLARADAARLLIVGSGRVASLLAEAYKAVLPLTEVAVWSRNPAAAAALSDSLGAQGFSARAWPDLEAAVRQADIVSCATLSTAPLIRGEWLQPGSHLDLIGGFTPQMVEADDACFTNARLFVDTEEALLKAGDLLGPMSRGVFGADDVQATLAQLCRGERGGRRNAGEKTVFKSVGTALEDLAAAMLVISASA